MIEWAIPIAGGILVAALLLIRKLCRTGSEREQANTIHENIRAVQVCSWVIIVIPLVLYWFHINPPPYDGWCFWIIYAGIIGTTVSKIASELVRRVEALEQAKNAADIERQCANPSKGDS